MQFLQLGDTWPQQRCACCLAVLGDRPAQCLDLSRLTDALRKNEGQEYEKRKKNVNKYLRKRERCKMQNITESERWE
jgi:hypothetical protein